MAFLQINFFLPRHLNFWLQWIAHPLAYTGQQWLKHAHQTHLLRISMDHKVQLNDSRTGTTAPGTKKDSNVDAKWWPVQQTCILNRTSGKSWRFEHMMRMKDSLPAELLISPQRWRVNIKILSFKFRTTRLIKVGPNINHVPSSSLSQWLFYSRFTLHRCSHHIDVHIDVHDHHHHSPAVASNSP